MVKWGMNATLRLYQQLGFEVVGNCTLAEALIANDEGDLLPADYEVQEKYCTQSGHVMIQRLSRGGK
jgi:adenine/guanine phosphoribosyltransferase-like PRPP-binding protein